MSSSRILGSILTGVALAITIIGIMFRFQSWPGTAVMIGGGLVALSVIIIIAFRKYRKTRVDFYCQVLLRTGIIGSIALILMLMPRSKFHGILYRNHTEYIEALKQSDLHPEDKALREKKREAFGRMKNRKKYKNK